MEPAVRPFHLAFGNKSDAYFNYTQGKDFIDGRQNGWMDLGFFQPEHEKKVDYLQRCGRYHRAAEKFLMYGRMLKPLLSTNEVPKFSEPGFGSGMYEAQRAAEVPAPKLGCGRRKMESSPSF